MSKPVLVGHDQLAEFSRTQIEQGSRSFALASLLFDASTRRGAYLLYSWCRYCDDQIDHAANYEQARERLETLHLQTQRALGGRPCDEPVFQSLSVVSRQYQIPHQYFEDMLEGMRMDLEGFHYETFEDLRLYCYHVAGVVGLMMAHIMGVSDARALAHAKDLGIAMQLTNISRDVFDDLALNRVYLPSQWLQEYGLNRQNLGVQNNRRELAIIVKRLISRARGYYRSGLNGLKYLNFRSALTIAAAAEIYSGIHRKVLRRGVKAWDSRVYTHPLGKLVALVRAVVLVMGLLPVRLVHPWSRTSLDSSRSVR